MREEIYIVMHYLEIEALIREYLGTPEYEGLVGDLCTNDSRWQNDTTHTFQIGRQDTWIQPNHDNHLLEMRERGKPAWGWEIVAVLEELVQAGRIEPGNYLIQVSW